LLLYARHKDIRSFFMHCRALIHRYKDMKQLAIIFILSILQISVISSQTAEDSVLTQLRNVTVPSGHEGDSIHQIKVGDQMMSAIVNGTIGGKQQQAISIQNSRPHLKSSLRHKEKYLSK